VRRWRRRRHGERGDGSRPSSDPRSAPPTRHHARHL
jgi:hypothetical protein